MEQKILIAWNDQESPSKQQGWQHSFEWPIRGFHYSPLNNLLYESFFPFPCSVSFQSFSRVQQRIKVKSIERNTAQSCKFTSAPDFLFNALLQFWIYIRCRAPEIALIAPILACRHPVRNCVNKRNTVPRILLESWNHGLFRNSAWSPSGQK